ncbi:vitronectin [Spea bombifrons]|uniref:vitronectin n=1 Tax=Spea bombifrons TaxID=233779 RepID=UPI0023494652|nr:vitronectin [Spea bombifrons]
MASLKLLLLLLLGAVCVVQAAEESCEGFCFDGFIASRKCQCDILCTYYGSCCSDYEEVCKPKQTRGDVFAVPEDGDYGEAIEILSGTETVNSTLFEDTTILSEDTTVTYSTLPTTTVAETTVNVTDQTHQTPDSLCSGESFDAFTNLKNGSIYAFRGKYFYELDDKKALDGYPKLIKDVWGIDGPIDSAFTRVNCQGKTYLFKGKHYWRFTDGILDSGYPREISNGFHKIPDDIDAAFALPANNYQGKEKVYFFKGNRYWQYEFKNQPTWEECLETEPSELFTHYVRIQDNSLENLFELLFGIWKKSSTEGPRYISRDWKGVPSNLDAVLPSRIYVPRQTRSSLRRSKRRKSRRRNNRRKSNRRTFDHDFLYSLFDDDDDDDEYSDPDWLPPENIPRCQPIQSVYFFKKDKYYRVNLQTKRVDKVSPRYPRPIGKYWLGCEAD